MLRNYVKLFCIWAFLSVLCVFFSPDGLMAQQSSTATGMSRAFNPSIGANGLFLGVYSDEGDPNGGGAGDNGPGVFTSGLRIQEMEVGLRATVDPYLRAFFTLSLPSGGDLEIEEGYVQTIGLSRGFRLLIGKSYLPFGKHNRLHTHAFPMIDAPWPSQALLGDDGLNDVGAQLSFLAPLPWFSEATVAVFDPGEGSVFITKDGGDLACVANWRNLWDITPEVTMEWGVSWAGARTLAQAARRMERPFSPASSIATANDDTVGMNIVGTDITFKHVSSNYHNWDVSSEYIQGMAVSNNRARTQLGGLTGYFRYEVSRRWWVQGRGDVLGLPLITNSAKPAGQDVLETGDTPWRATGGLALVLSEFTVVRLQYDYMDKIIEEPENRLMLQLNVTFGAHPAHTY